MFHWDAVKARCGRCLEANTPHEIVKAWVTGERTGQDSHINGGVVYSEQTPVVDTFPVFFFLPNVATPTTSGDDLQV